MIFYAHFGELDIFAKLSIYVSLIEDYFLV